MERREKCFQKNIGSAASKTGQGLGTLDESAAGRFLGFFVQVAELIMVKLGKELKEVDGVGVVGKTSSWAFRKAPPEPNPTRAKGWPPWLKVSSIAVLE